MRIIYLHQYFNTPAMSGGTRSYEMARRFVTAGHEVHMITTSRLHNTDSREWFHEKIDGINVHWLPIPYSNEMTSRKRIKAFMSFAFFAGKKAVQLRGDIVFATSTPLTIAFPAVFAAKRLNVPMIFEVRDLWPELPIAVGALKNPIGIKAAKWLERYAYRNSTRIVALSPGMAEGVALTGYPENKIYMIPNGCDLDKFAVSPEIGHSFLEAHPYLKGSALIVYAGTLGSINGVGYIPEIAHEMLSFNPTIRFLIAGAGKEVDMVWKKANELGVLQKNLWMIPPLPKEKMPGLFSASTVSTSLFVNLPEMWNNSANKFFDSLAAGKPLLINYKGWQGELIEETGAGIVVPPKNPPKAAKLLKDFLSDHKQIENAGKAAFELARKRFDRNKLSSQMLDIICEVVKEKVE